MNKKYLLGCVSAALMFAGTAFAQDNSSNEPSKPSDLEKAFAALKYKQPKTALELVDPIILKAEEKDAKDPDAMCPGNAAAFLLAFMKNAGKHVTVTVENDWCDAMLVRGYALVELEKFDEATATLAKLIRHDAGNAQYRAEYAFTLRAAGKIDEAYTQYVSVRQLASKYKDKATKNHWQAVALRGIGYIEFDRGNWDLAERAYRDSLKVEPNNPIALSELNIIKTKRAQTPSK